MKLSVVGLGKLGACSAACFASRGFDVIGVDINKFSVDAVNNGKMPVYEPKLQELIDSSKDRLKATQDYEEAIKESDITFLIVPTPSGQDGQFSHRHLLDVLKHLSIALKKANKEYHLFVITSTVTPGTTEEILIPFIESASGMKLNKNFGVCYNPEFIALGSAITDFLNPDMVLIGESNKFAGDRLESIYKVVCQQRPYIARMSIISAEITKISLNSYITMKISFANTLANICERIPGADIDTITKALGADKRISPFYLKGGLSFGGPCFPVDNKAFVAFASKYGVDALLAKDTDAINQLQSEKLVELVMSHVSAENNKVSVIGLAYKPNTPVIEGSPAIKLIENLLKKNIEILAYDPLAMDNTRAYFNSSVFYASSARDCFSRSTVSIITTQAEEFKLIDNSYIVNNPTTIIDCWRILDPSIFDEKVRYVMIGRSS